jgi:RHS repeat-associated protein
VLAGVVLGTICGLLLTASAQLAPVVGTHYAARASETGFAGAVNSRGGYGTSVPLDLPPVRGDLPLPLQVVYGGRQVGAAGLGWDVPLSYIFRSATIGHRRPQPAPFFSVITPFPVDPPVEYLLVLGGERVDLVRNAADTAWLGRRGGTQLEVRTVDDATMVMYDGEGRTYIFSSQGRSAGSRLVGWDLYLLVAITAHDNTVHFSYFIEAPVLPNGNTALSINVSNVTYNQSPTDSRCFKNTIQLFYDAPAALPAGSPPLPPLALSTLNGTVLARVNKLTSMSVRSKASCSDPEQVLRDYTFNYQDDPDTRRPQLRSVTMTGRQGTPERSVTLPVASYSYGSIVDPATRIITYRFTDNAGPPFVIGAHHYAFGVSYTSAEVSPEPHAPSDALLDLFTTQAFIDLNGDGRPDFLSEVGFYRNVPGPSGTTAFSERVGLGIDTTNKVHSAYLGLGGNARPLRIGHTVVNDTLRQLIDMNGDGRLDVVETVLPDIDHWIIHLNTPDPTDPTKSVFVDIKVPVTQMRLALNTTGLSFGRVPLARNTTVQENYPHCWEWFGVPGAWVKMPLSSCPEVPVDTERRTRTITEFELKDVNGDGYPDFVYNASTVRTRDPLPANYVPPPPQDPTQEGQFTSLMFAGDMAGPRDVKVLINTAGVHLADGADLFASPTTLEVGGANGCGINRWEADPTSISGEVTNKLCAFDDVNGDGIVDRITSAIQNGQIVATAALGTGVPDEPYSNDAIVTLPGPLARTETDLVKFDGKYRPRACVPPFTGPTFDLRRTRALRDINGDGVPDYISGQLQEREPGIWTVAMGTGAGFAPPVHVESHYGLEPSRERSVCGALGEAGEIAATPTGLYDIDGDGQPEIVNLNRADPSNPHWDILQIKPPVGQVDVGTVAGVPASGRLTKIDNGYGAVTRIGYKSAKEDMHSLHNLPYPEIVVTAVATTDTSAAGVPLESTTHYAYHGAGLSFDPGVDAFIFLGYQRTVELRATSEEVPDGSVAVVTDTYGLAPFDPAMDITARFQRYLQAGRVKDVTTLSGRLGTDPWVVATGDISTSVFRISGAHYDWEARLLTTGPTPRPVSNERCIDMMFPYDFVASLSNGGFVWEDECTKRGFLFQQTVTAWRGDPGTGDPFTSERTVKTKTEVKSVDDFGRTTAVALLNDTARSDDDLCVRTVFATPIGTNERVLSAPASRTVTADVCDNEGAVPRVSDTYEYDTSATGDKLPAGKVSAGLLTSRTVSRRHAETGAPIADASGASDIRVFDATYDPVTGVMTSITTAREDGATRTVNTTYDVFAVAPLTMRSDATNAGGTTLPPLHVTITRDALTLDPTSVTNPNGTQVGYTYDGFGRMLLSSVTPPSGPAGVLSATSYLGFALGDSSGRRVVTKRFTDPVAPSHVNTAVSRTSTIFLDALGRETRTEAALGADYAHQILVLVRRTYDQLGRVKFEADPHPSTEDADTAYGTSFFFNIDGSPSCFVRGRGPHAYTEVSDETAETYPTCLHRYFAAHQERVDVRDAASLLAGSPQAMTFEETAYSAIGQVLGRSTFLVDFDGVPHRLEEVQFGYDPLGHLTRMIRKDVAHPPASVTTTWHYDNLDQVIGLEELDVAPQFRSYDRWGALLSTQWCDATISSCSAGTINRRTDYRYDARGRLVHSEEKTNNAVNPETVKDFVYDQGVNTATLPVAATNVLGRLATATAPTSAVSFSYDAFGRVNAQVFTDRTVPSNDVYVQKHDYHGDGSLHTLHLLLPDNAFKDERTDYSYDSAGRIRSVTYNDGTSQSLFAASGSTDIYDVFGRIRKAQYAAATYTATYADTGRRLLTDVTVAAPGGGGTREISFLPVPGTSGSITAIDPLGRERVRTEIQAGNAQPAMVSEYDALGRLANTSVLFNATVFPLRSFTYDSLGNLLTQADLSAPSKIGANTLTYQITDRDRICSIAYGTATPPAACNVAYDGVGNIVSQPDRNNHSRTFTYFPGGQVATIVRGDTTATFDYDAFGGVQRLVLNSPSAADTRNDKHFGGLIYRRDEMVAGVRKSVITRSIPGPGGLIATRHGPGQNDPWTFTFGEARGARFVTDHNGTVTQDLAYHPYGEVVSNGAPPGSQKYQNQQWNGGDALAALGLSQLGARLYDPVIGRFLSRDPLVIPRTASTTNPYAFAYNDPVNHSDPSGLDGEVDPTNTPQPLPGWCFLWWCGGGGSGGGGSGGSGGTHGPKSGPKEPHTSTTTSGRGATLPCNWEGCHQWKENMDRYARLDAQWRATHRVAITEGEGLPRSLRKIVGSLDYYQARHEDFRRRHPGESPPSYYLQFGDVNVRRFTLELRPKLSIWGKEWVDSTRGLLQSAIENLRDADPEAFDRLEQDDKAFTKFAFDSHPRAYIQGGLATVTDDDAVMIMKFAGDQASLKHIVVTGVPFLDQRGQLNNNWRFGMKRQFDMARACAMCPFPGRP